MRKLGSSLVGVDDPGEIISRLFAATNDPWYQRYSESVAEKMVTHLFTDAGRTWRQAARVNSQGRQVYAALQQELQGPLGDLVKEAMERNAEYIKSVPADVANAMTDHVLSKSMAGMRPSDIAAELQERFKDITDVKANLIARTETAKTATALTRGRSELLGIPAYVWRTSEDARVRSSHRIMDGVIVMWGDAPSPEELDGEDSVGHYHAGEIWNCRCFAEPVINLDVVKWPVKVYQNGSFARMSRAEFERILPRQVV